jgi:ferritin
MDAALRSGLSRQVERLLASHNQQLAIAVYFHQLSMRRTAQSFYSYADDDATSIRTLIDHLGRNRLRPDIGPIASPQSTFKDGDSAMRLAMEVELDGGAALGLLLGRARAVPDLSVEQLIHGLHETHVIRLASLRALSRIMRRNASKPDGVEASLFRSARLGA